MSMLPTSAANPASVSPGRRLRVLAQRWSRREQALLALLLGLALVLRLWQIETWSFTTAEARALGGGHAAWSQPAAGFCARVYAEIVGSGSGEGWWRLPSALGSACAVLLLVLVGELFVTRGTALLGALLLAVHPAAVAAGQSLLPGVWGLDCVLIAGGAMILAHREREPGWAVVAVVAAGFAMVLDLAQGYAIAGYALGIAMGRVGKALRAAHLALAAGAAGVPLWHLWRESARAQVGVLAALDGWLTAVQPWWLGLAAVGALCSGALVAARRRALCGSAALPLAAGAAAAACGLTPGGAEAALPGICLFAALGAQAVASRMAGDAETTAPTLRRAVAWFPAAALVVHGAIAVVLQATAFAGARPAFREAAAVVLRQARSQRLLVHAAGAAPALRQYLAAGGTGAGVAEVLAADVGGLGRWLAATRAVDGAADGARAPVEFAVVLRTEWLALQAACAALGAPLAPGHVVAVLPSTAHPESQSLYVLRQS